MRGVFTQPGLTAAVLTGWRYGRSTSAPDLPCAPRQLRLVPWADLQRASPEPPQSTQGGHWALTKRPTASSLYSTLKTARAAYAVLTANLTNGPNRHGPDPVEQVAYLRW